MGCRGVWIADAVTNDRGCGVDEEDVRVLRERLQDEISNWQQLCQRYGGQLLERQLVLDNNGRAIERIDHPRVSYIPTLRYGKPDAAQLNWTLLAPAKARQLVGDLDRQHPAFAPHRVQDILELIRDRICAAEQGLRFLAERFPSPDQEDDGPVGMRP